MDTNIELGKSYLIHFKNGRTVHLAGKTITEAFAQTGEKTPDGNINFSILDFYIPVYTILNPDSYQLYVLSDKKSQDWKAVGKENSNFSLVEGLMQRKVKVEGLFSALVYNVTTGKIQSWVWANA